MTRRALSGSSRRRLRLVRDNPQGEQTRIRTRSGIDFFRAAQAEGAQSYECLRYSPDAADAWNLFVDHCDEAWLYHRSIFVVPNENGWEDKSFALIRGAISSRSARSPCNGSGLDEY